MAMKSGKLLALALGISLAAPLHAAEIERPRVQLIDRFGVNVATGQVTNSLQTVSIGGAMGVAHSVSVYANNFNFPRYRGFADKYYLKARYIDLAGSDPWYSPRGVMRVQDDVDSVDFCVGIGTCTNGFQDMSPPYSYIPIPTGDERHSLEMDPANGDLVWTKPDGTVVKFWRGGPTAKAGQEGTLYEIKHPTGFTLTVHSAGMAVTTNTGYMLKALYQSDNRDFRTTAPAKADNPLLRNVGPWYTSDASSWSVINPKFIKAINTAHEYCTPTATTCTLTQNWPTATFNWPAGMPRSMFIGDSTMNIVDAQGGVTEYRFRAYDLAYDEYGNVVEPYRPNEEMSPRLVGIKPAASNVVRFTYDYINKFNLNSYGESTWNLRAFDAGVVRSATDIAKSAAYAMLQPYMGTDYYNDGFGGGIGRVFIQPNSIQGNKEKMQYASTDDGMIWFEHSTRNFPTRYEKSDGTPTESYAYTRSNLSGISIAVNGTWQPNMTANFPASCTPATRKTCNQATWIRDAEGKTTSYTYHPESGQVETITYPANKRGVVAQKRYAYTQLSASYFNGGATKITGTPIWMKTAERYCIDSNYTGSSCANNDEVVTRFEYTTDNLQLKGVVVTDASGATRRTCYQYDKLGNRIGVTNPKANMSSCP
jgi:YD repeat-containing protein